MECSRLNLLVIAISCLAVLALPIFVTGCGDSGDDDDSMSGDVIAPDPEPVSEPTPQLEQQPQPEPPPQQQQEQQPQQEQPATTATRTASSTTRAGTRRFVPRRHFTHPSSELCCSRMPCCPQPSERTQFDDIRRL